MGLSDDLGKLDTYVEGVTRKIANYLREVLEDQRDKLAENLLANNCMLLKTRKILFLIVLNTNGTEFNLSCMYLQWIFQHTSPSFSGMQLNIR